MEYSSLPGSVNTEVLVQVKHVGTLGFIVDLSPPLALILSDQFPHVLGDELVLVGFLSDEAAPACNVTGGHEQFLPELPLDHDVPAGVGLGAPLQPPVQTSGAEVWVALPAGQVTGAGVCGALTLALTPGEPVVAVQRAKAELLTKVARLPAGAGLL